jgi:hypothetical protein
VYSNTIEDVKPSHQPSTKPAQQIFPSAHQSYATNPPTTTTTAPYMRESLQPHGQTPYPAAYNAYSSTTPTQNLSYTPSAGYPTMKYEQGGNLEAPLLEAFATQASQLPATNHSATQYAPNNASSSWQQYTSAMVGNLEMQDCYSATALIQMQGSREIGDTPQAAIAVTTEMGGGHLVAGQVSGMEGQWPLIFDVTQGS